MARFFRRTTVELSIALLVVVAGVVLASHAGLRAWVGNLTSVSLADVETNRALLAAVVQTAGTLLVLVLTVLIVVSQINTRYRYPLSYLLSLSFAEWVSLAIPVSATVVPVLVLMFHQWFLTPVAVALFVLSLYSILSFIKLRLRHLSLDGFFEWTYKQKNTEEYASQWRDIARQALEARDYRDVRRALVALADVSIDGRAESIRRYIQVLFWDATDLSRVTDLFKGVYCFSSPLAEPQYLCDQTSVEQAVGKALERGCGVQDVVKEFRNRRFSAEEGSVTHEFWRLRFLYERAFERIERLQLQYDKVYFTAYSMNVLFDYYIMNAAHGFEWWPFAELFSRRANRTWPAVLDSTFSISDCEKFFADEDSTSTVFWGALSLLEKILTGKPRGKEVGAVMIDFKGEAWNCMLSEAMSRCDGSPPCYAYSKKEGRLVLSDVRSISTLE